MARTKIYDLFSEDGLFGQSDAAREWLAIRQIIPVTDSLNRSAPRQSAGQGEDTYLNDPMRAARGWGF